MASETEIEKMVVRLTGDNSKYKDMLNQSTKDTTSFEKDTTASLDKIDTNWAKTANKVTKGWKETTDVVDKSTASLKVFQTAIADNEPLSKIDKKLEQYNKDLRENSKLTDESRTKLQQLALAQETAYAKGLQAKAGIGSGIVGSPEAVQGLKEHNKELEAHKKSIENVNSSVGSLTSTTLNLVSATSDWEDLISNPANIVNFGQSILGARVAIESLVAEEATLTVVSETAATALGLLLSPITIVAAVAGGVAYYALRGLKKELDISEASYRSIASLQKFHDQLHLFVGDADKEVSRLKDKYSGLSDIQLKTKYYKEDKTKEESDKVRTDAIKEITDIQNMYEAEKITLAEANKLAQAVLEKEHSRLIAVADIVDKKAEELKIELENQQALEKRQAQEKVIEDLYNERSEQLRDLGKSQATLAREAFEDQVRQNAANAEEIKEAMDFYDITQKQIDAEKQKATARTKAAEEATSAYEKWDHALQGLNKAFEEAGLSQEEKELAAYMETVKMGLGLTQEEIDAENKRARAIIEATKAKKDAAEQVKKDDEEVKKILEKVKTPLEKFDERIKHLTGLKGKLGEEGFKRAVEEAQKELEKELGKDLHLKVKLNFDNEALHQGTAQLRHRFLEFQDEIEKGQRDPFGLRQPNNKQEAYRASKKDRAAAFQAEKEQRAADYRATKRVAVPKKAGAIPGAVAANAGKPKTETLLETINLTLAAQSHITFSPMGLS